MYHDAAWTPEQVERFWNAYASNQRRRDNYFSKLHGSAIVRVANRFAHLSGLIVDVGCGNGALLEALLADGFFCEGVDASAISVQNVLELFETHPGFRGARVGTVEKLPLGDGKAGAVFLVEVLEHLDSTILDRALAELQRVIRPGGHLVVTVPNNEDLQAEMLACPECGCVFHRMQHVRSLTSDSLGALIQQAGFELVRVLETDFAQHRGSGLDRIVSGIRGIATLFRQGPRPHLMAIARRSETRA